MFKVPNKTGFEVVMHFLLTRLSASKAKERFRYISLPTLVITNKTT